MSPKQGRNPPALVENLSPKQGLNTPALVEGQLQNSMSQRLLVPPAPESGVEFRHARYAVKCHSQMYPYRIPSTLHFLMTSAFWLHLRVISRSGGMDRMELGGGGEGAGGSARTAATERATEAVLRVFTRWVQVEN